MAERFIIRGGKPLNGVVEISGSKNDAGPVLAATLLSEEPLVIDNLPLIEDVFKMIKLLESMGAKIEWLDRKKIKVETREAVPEKLDFSLLGETRMSVLLIGPLVARFGQFKFSSPGGDRIGLRPIDTHLEALKKIGIKVEKEGEFYCFDGRELRPATIVLKEFSVTATETIMLASSLIEGETTIEAAAAEPHVEDLGCLLKEMGAEVKGMGSHTIKIAGKKKLRGVCHKIIPDYLETGTFLVAAAVVPKTTVEIRNAVPEQLSLFLAKMEESGVFFEKGKDFLRINSSSNLKPIRIQALPHPGFPTDLLPIVVPLLTQTGGRSLIHDPLYENRLNFIHELRKMGADIEIVDPHRAFVFGKTPLSGIKISSFDIRAGASLVIAGLMAQGETVIENVYQIDRGYEKIDEKLRALGADISRVS